MNVPASLMRVPRPMMMKEGVNGSMKKGASMTMTVSE